MGELLTGRQSYDWLLDSIAQVPPDLSLSICSAFIKYQAMERILQECQNNSGNVLVRWQKFDLCAGSSDLSIYQLLKDRGWKLYMDTRFHGKVYELPNVGILMGSANATNAGFSISKDGSREVCTILPEGQSATNFIRNLFSYATLVDDHLFSLLQAEFEAVDDHIKSKEEWGPEIVEKFVIDTPVKLLVSDFFSTNPEGQVSSAAEFENDLELLGINSLDDISQPILKEKIIRIKSIAWILNLLADYPEGIYFGELTVLLHGSMIEDPAPYRSTVKSLLANSIGWLNSYCSDIIVSDRPNYSQRIKLRC